jgi:hypothetical protein
MENISFAVLLSRLIDARQLDVQALSHLAQVPELEVLGALECISPSPLLLRQLAVALNLHTADLVVMAGLPLSQDLLPLDARAQVWIPRLVAHAMHLPEEGRFRLRQLAQSIPREVVDPPGLALRSYEQYPPSGGALFVRMLANRNLDWSASAKVLYQMTGEYLAASTIGAIGHGRKKLTADLVAGLGTVLGMQVSDLSGLTGFEFPGGMLGRAAPGVAELIWDIRRLTAHQVRRLNEEAKSMS